MTEETATIQRLDYSKPPPGYSVRFEDSSGANGDGPPLWWYGAPHCLASMGSEAEATAAAWAHYKAHNDPPGMNVYVDREDTHLWFAEVDVPEFITPTPDGCAMEAAARAAAWTWYDRRLAFAVLQTFTAWKAGGQADVWPRCLTWSDDQVAKVERWLVDSTAEMPEVLRA